MNYLGFIALAAFPAGWLLASGSVRAAAKHRRVHFGLGADDKIAAIEIKWPSGVVQQLKDVRPDQILKLEEPH